jgi:hypothetical protein
MKFMKPAIQILHGEVPQEFAACQPATASPEDLVSLEQLQGDFKKQGMYPPSPAIVYISVEIPCHMEDNIVIRGIQVVLMPVPVRGAAVDLHISGPEQVADADPCIKEIRSPVGILLPRGYDFELLPATAVQGFYSKIPVFPDKLDQSFMGHQ